MTRVVEFCIAVAKNWGSLVTGGVIIGLIGTWQGTGHAVASWIYAVVAGGALVISLFKAWDEQLVQTERAERRIIELQGRPDVTLTCASTGGFQIFDPKTMTYERGTTSRFVFKVRNSGPGQAVNVSTDDIALPMSDVTQRLMLEEEQVFAAQLGEHLAVGKPGWNKWTVLFEPLSSVAQGQEVEIPYRIENMGPLQNKDICFCLGNTVRSQTAEPLHLPLTLRFSNRDGFTWAQSYEMEHRFVCHISVVFRGVKVINP